MSDCLNNSHTVSHQWKLRNAFVIFVGCVEACPSMLKVGAQVPIYFK